MYYLRFEQNGAEVALMTLSQHSHTGGPRCKVNQYELETTSVRISWFSRENQEIVVNQLC